MKKGFFNNRLFTSGMKNTTHFSEDEKHLKKRIENIMDDGKKSRGIIIISMVLALCLLCGSVIGFTVTKSEPKEPSLSDSETLVPKESTGKETQTNDTEQVQTEPAETVNAQTEADWSIFTSPIDTGLADEEQLNRLFYRAFTAGALFTGYGYKYPTYCEGATIMYENGENTARYAPTNIFGAETLSELREVLDGIFTSDVANALMNTQTYENFPLHIDQDGKLYRFGGFAAVESIDGAPKFDIKNIDQSSAEFTVYIYGDTVFTARADKVDGVWKMSKFDFPYAEYAQRNFKY